ncbi:hypothetical protein EON77_21025 [bacterium]|nr:MAG: hypothetical protein EON77_21025 [bacterium]
MVTDEGAPTVTASMKERGTDGLVGWEAFSYARSVFDFPARRLSVAVDRARAAQADRLAAFGFRFISDDAGTYRAYVYPGGPAERGGLRTADIVEEVDGLPPKTAADAGLSGVELPADWGTAPTLRLKILRGKERRILTLTAEPRR